MTLPVLTLHTPAGASPNWVLEKSLPEVQRQDKNRRPRAGRCLLVVTQPVPGRLGWHAGLAPAGQALGPDCLCWEVLLSPGPCCRADCTKKGMSTQVTP